MKKLVLTAFVFTLALMQVSAQTFPFTDDYESYNGFQIPTGYSGHATVYLAHGTGSPASKALSPFLTSFSTSDSSIFPLVGPMAPGIYMTFDWRIVDPSLYPSTPATFTAGDKFEILGSSDGISYTSLFEINSANYANSTSFTPALVDLNAFSSGSLYLKVRGTRVSGSGEFFIDIDNVNIDILSNIKSPTLSSLSVYPSPATGFFNFTNSTPISGTLDVLDVMGKVVLTRNLVNESSAKIDISGIASGNYKVRIQSDSKVKISNLVIR